MKDCDVRENEGELENRLGQWEQAVNTCAAQNGGVLPTEPDALFEDRHRLVRLHDAKLPATTASDTETLLNSLIEDCHFLIRELAFHSARLTPDEGARLRFLASAGQLALNGAKVGRVVAGLRSGGPIIEERRQRLIVEHVQTVTSPARGEGGTP